jgi:hypothetical protein
MSYIEDFTSIILKDKDHNLFYSDLLDINIKEQTCWEIINIINKNPSLLTEKIDDSHLIYDYLFDFVILNKGHPALSIKIYNLLVELSDIITSPLIKENKRYVYMLQSNCCCYDELFESYIENKFLIDNFEYLLKSLISRGEIYKLKILFKFHKNLNEYSNLIEVATLFGRYEIIQFLIDNDIKTPSNNCLDYDINSNFNPRWMFYFDSLSNINNSTRDVLISKKNYLLAFKLVMKYNESGISIKTLRTWLEVAKNRNISDDALLFLISNVNTNIPLSDDFGDYNYLVFGYKEEIYPKYRNLEHQFQELKDRYQKLEYKYKNLLNQK